MPERSYLRRIVPLVLTGFFTACGDSAFKFLALLVAAGASWDYFRAAPVLLLVATACILPFVILPQPAGYLADRISKRYVIILSRITNALILIGGILSLNWLDTVAGVAGVVGVLFLSASVSACFHPAFGGIYPETFSEPEISRACGRIEAAKTLGIIVGIVSSSGVYLLSNGNLNAAGYLVIIAAFLAIVFSIAILPVIAPVQRKKDLIYPMVSGWRLGWKELTRNYGILLAALGDVFIIAVGLAVQPLLIVYSIYTLGLPAATDVALLQLIPVLGLAIGSVLAGKWSGRKIELGLVPIGALVMALGLGCLVWWPGELREFTLGLPEYLEEGENVRTTVSLTIRTGALLSALLCGVAAGCFLLPVRSFLLQRLTPERRGAALGVKNSWTFLTAALLMLVTTVFALGACKNQPELPSWLAEIAACFPVVSPRILLVTFGMTVLAVTVLTMWLLPNFMLRFIILTLGHTLYRIRVVGAENIPARGAAMFLSNHVSLIDSILISSCTSRQIRFLLHENYYSVPLLGFIARMTGFFKVPSRRKAKSMGQFFDAVQKSLREGGIVCVFPEGKVSRNGLMSEFKHGYLKMLPPECEVPIIPVNISFVWGSIFSYYAGSVKLRLPSHLPFIATISFGKPMSRKDSPFEIRQSIGELAAEAAREKFPREQSLQLALARLSHRHPFRPLLADSGGRKLSSLQLLTGALQLSRQIRSRLSGEGECIGILLPNGVDQAMTITAVLLADRIVAPLNYSMPREVLTECIRRAEIPLVITQKEYLEKHHLPQTKEMVFLEDLQDGIACWKKVLIFLAAVLLPPKELMNMFSPLSAFDRERNAVLLFSSGSTGVPKGVLLTHHNLYTDVYAVANSMLIGPNDRILGNLPLFHSFGLNTCFFLAVLRGAQVIYVSNPLDGRNVCRTLKEEKITICFATPSFLLTYLHRAEEGTFESLRLMVTGAEKLRNDIAVRFHEITGKRLVVVEAYGSTELAPVVTVNLAESSVETGQKFGRNGSIGLPLENISVRILDPLSYQPVAPGEEGLLCVKGPIVMRGYLNDPATTAKVMHQDYYDTGDIARMNEDGYIDICGRLSRFSKIAGEMVPHEMVENIINELCGGHRRTVAVCGMPDPAKGEVLLVLHLPDLPMTPDEIVEQLRERSISNLWIPKAKHFRQVEQLPLLASGKLNLQELRRQVDDIVAEMQSSEGKQS